MQKNKNKALCVLKVKNKGAEVCAYSFSLGIGFVNEKSDPKR